MKLLSIHNRPLTLWVAGLWVAIFLLICIFCALTAPQTENIPSHWMTIISAPTAMLLPLPWFTARRRWAVWVALSIFTIYLLIAVSYWRNFSSLIPHSAIFQVTNVDEMVVDSAAATFKLADLLLLLPILSLAAGWFLYWRKHKEQLAFNSQIRKRYLIVMASIWVVLRLISFIHYEISHSRYHTPLADLKAKFRGKLTTRYHYMLNNGFELYLLWGFSDFFPVTTLDKADKTLIANFLNGQEQMWNNKIVNNISDTPNLLIIMVESFETWPLDYRIEGKPALPYLDSLTKAPGSLYFPHLVSQVSNGHSSDGHLMDLTGILPLRENAAVTDFAENDYPSLPKAFRQKYGGHTYEIISDVPDIWKQTVTYSKYGFEKLYHFDHIDPKHKSNWTQRDAFLCKYMEEFLDTVQQPFATMCVTLSLHTPYRSTIKGYPEIDRTGVDPQSIHYLKICRMDENYIRRIIDTLRRRGIYENTVIAITGDHCAHSLFDEHRPPSVAGKERYIPLIVLNSHLPTREYSAIAGQIDIYPTLLDILGLQDYKWHGVGVSLLRCAPGGATRRTGEQVGKLSAQEAERQKTAWDVSDLLIRSNELAGK